MSPNFKEKALIDLIQSFFGLEVHSHTVFVAVTARKVGCHVGILVANGLI